MTELTCGSPSETFGNSLGGTLATGAVAALLDDEDGKTSIMVCKQGAPCETSVRMRGVESIEQDSCIRKVTEESSGALGEVGSKLSLASTSARTDARARGSVDSKNTYSQFNKRKSC